jgi:hypothetical protein
MWAMSVIVVRRIHAQWRDRRAGYRVIVDGRQRVAIGDDETVQIPVTPGVHAVRVERGWRGSKELKVEIAHGQILRFECGPNRILFLGLLYLYWRNQYIWLNTVTT